MMLLSQLVFSYFSVSVSKVYGDFHQAYIECPCKINYQT